MKRPGVTVAARKGYFAVRNTGGMPINPWEAPALGALEQKPVPNAFPVRAGALLFPERGRPGLVPVVVDLKTAPLTFQTADGRQDLHVRLHGPRAVSRPAEPGRAEGEPALRDQGPLGRARAREAGGRDLLSGAGAFAWRLHDGDGRARCAVGQVERATLDRRSAEDRSRRAAHEQPRAGQARGEGAGRGSPRRQSAARQGRDPLSEPRRAGQQSREGSRLLLRRVSGGGRSRAEAVDRAAAGRQAGRAGADAARGAGPTRAESSRSGACRSTSSRQEPTSCAPS